MDCLEARPTRSARRHPWERVRFSFFERLLARTGRLRPGVSILDVGSGDGWFGLRLAENLPVEARIVCWDQAYELAGPPHDPGSRPIKWTPERPAERFDLLLLLDVLEHIEDDVSFLKRLVSENLEPGGYALISVPAWPALFSNHDRFLRHHRRYRGRQAHRLAVSAGLTVLRQGGLFYSLLPLRGWLAWRERFQQDRTVRSQAESWTHGPRLTYCVEAFLRADSRLSGWLASLGFRAPGLSWWALCIKP